MKMCDKEFIKIVEEMTNYYPDHLAKAAELLLTKYQLPVELVTMILAYIKLRVEVRNAITWPMYDCKTSLFCVN